MSGDKAFVAAAEELLAECPIGTPMQVTLRYMLANARGSDNAKTLPVILRHLASRGIRMQAKVFQQTIVKETRRNGVFIGSGPSGFFLIDSPKDVEVMHTFYVQRIAAERTHDSRLLRLARMKGWEL